MGAEFFSTDPQPTGALRDRKRASMGPRLRQVHRWVSLVFTLTVSVNFMVMIWGPPPAWITYSPLPALLILLLTGLYMLGRHYVRVWRAPAQVRPGRVTA